MSYTYANRKRSEKTAPQQEKAAPQPSLDSLRSGAAAPTAAQMGRRVDLPDAMRAKMEESFGADLSAVKLYESEAVANAGAEAVTQGSNIAFAPGMLDFSSFGGQALLGHELSHVVSQARGEVTGGGFLNDHALEARADREGAMAAAGQQITAPTAAMSGVSAAPAAGPMQAKKHEEPEVPADPKEASFAAAMPDLGKDKKYSSRAMKREIKKFGPRMRKEIEHDSQGTPVESGNRFFFMRQGKKGDKTGRFEYFRHLKAAGRKSNVSTMMDMSEDVDALPETQKWAQSYKAIHGYADRTQAKDTGITQEEYDERSRQAQSDLNAYQDRGLAMTRAYLAHLSEDKDAMDSLRQSSAMYSQLGVYSDQNKKGLVHGQLEADHRAMNDMLLRSFGADVNLSANMSQGSGMSKDQLKKVNITGQAMAAMQPAVLTNLMNPSATLTPQEAELAQVYSDFFQQLHAQ